MTITVSGTTLTFNDATTQTTAATAAGIVTTNNVLSATSSATSKAVGTYASTITNFTNYSAGTNYAGSSIGLSVGTWRCMSCTVSATGWTNSAGYGYNWYINTFLRIS